MASHVLQARLSEARHVKLTHFVKCGGSPVTLSFSSPGREQQRQPLASRRPGAGRDDQWAAIRGSATP